ncbi:MAG: sugar ABC transporter permease [Lachnospiraceae bacterium]|mgnify:CR=1 FL=1|jgi:putative aldouronate transport system permease protein|nr:sugar ABC transporter permease [Lachnospiraceae bacterium]MCI9098035.1 sugar ABC transporter permease [Lachnospiraceae bacterium]MCI9203084.1 sugar ABC transporter permease [Lachnospiraceae bacterium]QTO31347.1 putative multiple-sugar transport system permease YteP [uncultured bacterium]
MSTQAKVKKKNWFQKELPFHVMLLPAVIITIIFKYIPFVGISMAFEDYTPLKGIFDQTWVGMDNYKYLFSLPGFGSVIWNTIFIAVMKMIGNLIFPVLIALLLNEIHNKHYKKTVQTVLYLPHFISWAALAGIFIDILSPSGGIVNQLLNLLGMDSVFFLGDPKVFPYTMAITDVWKELGWGTIVYLAAITGIDPTYYEAAKIDGANRFQQVFYVTIPSILSMILLMMVLSVGNVLQAGFEQVFNLYSPQVYSTGDIIDTYVFRIGVIEAKFDLATAVGLFKSAISFVLIMIGYKAADKMAGYKVF